MSTLTEPDPTPVRTGDLPGTGGVLRAHNADFYVEEIPAYQPAGEGPHVFAWIEKNGLTTAEATAVFARALGISARDIGSAGLKDKHAITRQYLSLPPPIHPEQVLALDLPGVTVLSATRHPNKLRTGHLRGNRFRLRIRELGVPVAEAVQRGRSILDELARPPGCPNWFGEQRFGRSGGNAEVGRRLVQRDARTLKKVRGRQRRFLISSFQSQLFNDYLRARIAAGTFGRVLAGDVLRVSASGGLFVCDQPVVDQQRFDAGEVGITGPMFGHDMVQPDAGTTPRSLEDQLLADHALELTSFAHLGKLARGARRPLAVLVGAPSVTADTENGAVIVDFDLPAGSYATTIMREVTKTDTFPN